MPRTVLVHLNVEVPDTETRTADQIADAILSALVVGGDDESVWELDIVCPLAEEL